MLGFKIFTELLYYNIKLVYCTYYKTLMKANYHEQKVIENVFTKMEAIN